MTDQELTYLRTCQECGNKQWDRDPTLLVEGPQLNSYMERKCQKCKSEGSLDYGHRSYVLDEVDKIKREMKEKYDL